MITRQNLSDSPSNKALRARAPLMLLTANQPMPATTALIPAGSQLPTNPKPVRLSTIWHSPDGGPQLESTPWLAEPSAVPSTIAATVCQNDSPKKSGPMIPTAMVANSRLGEVQVQSRLS